VDIEHEIKLLKEKVAILMAATHIERHLNFDDTLLTEEEKIADAKAKKKFAPVRKSIEDQAKKWEKSSPRPIYREYTPDPNRVVSRDGVNERPYKKKITGLSMKGPLMYCKICRAETKHSTPGGGIPLRCRLNHGGKSLCNCCDTYTDVIAKAVLNENGQCYIFCALCIQPKTETVKTEIQRRRDVAHQARQRPISLNDSSSIARALGASSFGPSRLR
jgi:hypothetical protein